MDELLDLDATAQAELIATGKASATEVVGAAIAQAQAALQQAGWDVEVALGVLLG